MLKKVRWGFQEKRPDCPVLICKLSNYDMYKSQHTVKCNFTNRSLCSTTTQFSSWSTYMWWRHLLCFVRMKPSDMPAGFLRRGYLLSAKSLSNPSRKSFLRYCRPEDAGRKPGLLLAWYDRKLLGRPTSMYVLTYRKQFTPATDVDVLACFVCTFCGGLSTLRLPYYSYIFHGNYVLEHLYA